MEDSIVARPVSVRLDPALVAALRAIARKWAYAQQREVSWCDVLDRAARRLVAEENERPAQPRKET